MKYCFFGTDAISVAGLDVLCAKGLTPSLLVTLPKRRQGRGMKELPSPVEIWANARGIPCIAPESLKETEVIQKLSEYRDAVFITISYGRIIPQEILNIPKHGVLNIHPSLLPAYRGPAPVRSAILADDKEIGVTVMLMDIGLDTGPILAEKTHHVSSWPPAPELEALLAEEGARLLLEILPDWLSGELTARKQDESRATYTEKLRKEDAELDLLGDPYRNFLKIQAYAGSAPSFFFTERNGKKTRVVVKAAEFSNGVLTILRVVPEGKKEMHYADFLRGTSST